MFLQVDDATYGSTVRTSLDCETIPGFISLSNEIDLLNSM